MKLSLDAHAAGEILSKLSEANLAFARRFSGEKATRQPVHTVYGGAHLFKADTAHRLSQLALKSINDYAPNFVVFATVLKLPGCDLLPTSEAKAKQLEDALKSDQDCLSACFQLLEPGVSSAFEQVALGAPPRSASQNESDDQISAARLAYTVYTRVIEKLKREAVEDFRIDFEDGYGHRPDKEEDSHAERSAQEVARGLASRTLPPFIGIRIKPFTEELKRRGARTLDIFVTTLTAETKGTLPDNFVVTLPKVTIAEQIAALVGLLQMLESKNGLVPGSLKLELMIETPQSIINYKGEIDLPQLLGAAAGRLTGAHFGAYDYTASLNITASAQSLDHQACDFARNMMQCALAGTDIWLSDGATNIMPIAPHRVKDAGTLTEAQKRENTEVVHHAWKVSFDHISNSLRNGFYQGWDLHPAQLPIRYAACYAFFLQGLGPASTRLQSFIAQAAQATLVGDVFDDAATGQGLLNYFLRALNCGAITEHELQSTGLTRGEILTRSFSTILAARRQQAGGAGVPPALE